MTQKTVKLLIPFESLVDSITKLSLTEKRLLWELLAEQITQTEKEPLAVQEWISSDNDIYDEIFADVHPAR